MDSALNPREIQQRIRSGESLAQVAEAAGVPEAKIAPFADPVLAEREHIAGLARDSLLRQRGDGINNRSLAAVITQRMLSRRLDFDDLIWDAYRLPDRTWRISARLTQGELVRDAWFVYDPRARFSVCDNADARWLVREESVADGPEEEATVDLDDELALVRATSEPEPAPTKRGGSPAISEIDDELDGYIPPEFAEVDGLYDIVGPEHAATDTLYDVLAGISEDSVRIYEGLGSIVAEPTQPEAEQEPAELAVAEPEIPAAPVEELITEDELSEATAPLTEAEQDAMIEAPSKPKPAAKKRRASVPAWDDILFGGPKSGPKKKS